MLVRCGGRGSRARGRGCRTRVESERPQHYSWPLAVVTRRFRKGVGLAQVACALCSQHCAACTFHITSRLAPGVESDAYFSFFSSAIGHRRVRCPARRERLAVLLREYTRCEDRPPRLSSSHTCLSYRNASQNAKCPSPTPTQAHPIE